MEEMKNLVPVVFANQRVLTTPQLAEFYDTTTYRIRDNFRKAKKRFELGVDYFKLEGDVLKEFKASLFEVENFHLITASIAKAAHTLYLWTQQGAARHCKMLNTPKAWEVFNLLMTNYFNPPAPPAVVEQPPEKKKRKPPSDMAHAYGFLMSNATVKVGHAGEIDERIKRVESKHNLNVLAEHHTPKVAREVARKIEKRVHRKFVACRVNGEFFQAPFDDVKDALDKCYAEEFIEISTPEGVIPYEDRQLLVELCKINSPFQHELIKRTANILLGDNIF